MHVGLGLYRESLTEDNFRFAAQAGVTHIVAHLANYFSGATPTLSRGEEGTGWGDARGGSIKRKFATPAALSRSPDSAADSLRVTSSS